MIVLDTNVVSEAMKPRPTPAVMAWLDEQDQPSVFICAPVLAELRFGVERLAEGRRKEALSTVINTIESAFGERILPFDRSATRFYAQVAAKREKAGRRLEQMDGLIAAIALAHGAIVATRDIDGFSGLGLELINPFDLRGK
ncbi:MAG: type II toxin-antitoxin system VapC family toxin [Pseudorhodoplanes sp.]|nr:Toxin FitB [Pseudorhodoplanes sp.]MBW7950011.1 type II toxin-antitoxin system VapC family toxin [Pseudorhodoplanes sp.]MCL4711877.1 type II toxin-antitoxin system VapC family toxin [Pseudorhodoplanes sp.]MCQ3942512.1 type II toxin-antitoxin system VapC family toxin [Alphaproteobacteria bacterium]